MNTEIYIKKEEDNLIKTEQDSVQSEVDGAATGANDKTIWHAIGEDCHCVRYEGFVDLIITNNTDLCCFDEWIAIQNAKFPGLEFVRFEEYLMLPFKPKFDSGILRADHSYNDMLNYKEMRRLTIHAGEKKSGILVQVKEKDPYSGKLFCDFLPVERQYTPLGMAAVILTKNRNKKTV